MSFCFHLHLDSQFIYSMMYSDCSPNNVVKLVSVSPSQVRALQRAVAVAWHQMQFLHSPLLHQLDLVVLNANTIINFKRRGKQRKKMRKLMHATDNSYSDLQVPSEILQEILTFSNDYYDHILSMKNELSTYQYIIPQILNLIQFALIATLLVLPPNCIFFSILFNVCNLQNTDELSQKYNLFDLNTNEYEPICTDHELLGFMLCVVSVLQFMGIFAALFLNYKGKYTQKWMAIKNILSTEYEYTPSSSYPFELLYPFQKWCCIDRNYYLSPHSNFANLQLLKNSVHSVFWQFVNPLCLYVMYCLFKPALAFMLSVYYWQIYRFSMRYSDTDSENIQILFFFMLIWFFGIFFSRDVMRILCDGWIGSRISCLIIAEVYLQIYCNGGHGDDRRFDALNVMIWIVAASFYKVMEYLVMNLYFKSYVPCNHRTKHSIQQSIYDWYQVFFIVLMYVYGFGWLFVADHGDVFMMSQRTNSILRLTIGGLIWIDAQLDIVIFDKKIQNMSNIEVLKQMLFCREYKLMKDWRKKFKKMK
eukprot:62591_1